MLRFDVPQVYANVIRLEAFITFCIALVAYFISPWALVITCALGLIRGFIGHHRCPSHLLFKSIFSKLNIAGKKENAGAKMFANKILFIASLVALVLYYSGISMWRVPTVALIIFSFAEWAFSFCVACWAYGFWYSKFPPQA